MRHLANVIADIIYLENDLDCTPSVDECKSLIEDHLITLKRFLPDTLSSRDGRLLMAAILDAIDEIDWDVVVERIRFFRMEIEDGD